MAINETKAPDLRPGDVVRIVDTDRLGVVRDAHCLDDGRTYQWFVEVDTVDGVSTMRPDEILESNDPASVARARELGLEFPAARREGELRSADVVRTHDGRLGIVLLVQEHEEFLPGRVDVFVDLPGEGAGIWSPELLTLSNNPESIREAKELGLRFPWPGPDPEFDTST